MIILKLRGWTGRAAAAGWWGAVTSPGSVLLSRSTDGSLALLSTVMLALAVAVGAATASIFWVRSGDLAKHHAPRPGPEFKS